MEVKCGFFSQQLLKEFTVAFASARVLPLVAIVCSP
jgi:hypothetical protein